MASVTLFSSNVLYHSRHVVTHFAKNRRKSSSLPVCNILDEDGPTELQHDVSCEM